MDTQRPLCILLLFFCIEFVFVKKNGCLGVEEIFLISV